MAKLIKKYFLFFIAVIFLFEGMGLSAERKSLYRGARTRGMGGAFVGLSDDEQVLYQNPAGLAGYEKSEIHLLQGDVEFSSDILSSISDVRNAFSKFDSNTLNSILGENIYARGTATSSLIIPNFGIGFISDAQGAIYARNIALPQLIFGYQNTNGFITGFGFRLGKERRRPETPDIRFGVATKVLWRRGGYFLLTPNQLLQLSEGKSFLSETVGSYQLGFGLDLGSQYVQRLSDRFTLSAGLSFKDIGDTSFTGPIAQPIESDVTAGIGGKVELGLLDINMVYDLSQLNRGGDYRVKSHLGLELDFPLINLMFGLNQIYLTYGTEIDLGFFRLSALSYAEEIGTFAYQDSDRRYVIQFLFKFNL